MATTRKTSTPKTSSTPKKNRETGKKSTGLSKGKVLAAGAGVAAAAAAAGVAYFRKGSGAGEGRSVYHVLPADEGWAIQGDGADRAVSKHPTKKDALTAARDLVHAKVPSQLVVHKSDGSVQESWTYDD